MSDPTEAQRTDNTDLRAIIEEWGGTQIDRAHASAIVAAIVAKGWVGPRRMRTIERLQAVAISDWESAYGELRDKLADIRTTWGNVQRGWMVPRDVADAMRKAFK
mgnify:CR=1 FL=1